MKYINREVWAGVAAAACAFVIVACGGTNGGADGGSGCSVDADCGTGKMCHPLLKSCQISCTTASDCPSSAKTCATFAGSAYSAGGPAAFCQCSTGELCGGGQVCQSTSKICTVKCTSNSQCGAGVNCNTATGLCGSAPAGDAGCEPTNPQPDRCGYGKVCNTARGCDPAIDGTCSNVSAAISRTNHIPYTSASTGPVIFNAIGSTGVPSDCRALDDGGVASAFGVTVYAYSKDNFPSAKSDLPGFSYFTVAGSKVDVPLNLLKPENYMPTGKTMSAKFTLCGAGGTNQLQAAFGFTGGNAFCVNLTK